METIMETNSLQPYLTSMITTKKVRVRKTNSGMISLLPLGDSVSEAPIDVIGFMERKQTGNLPECITEFYGMFANSGDTLNDFMARKHADKVLDL